MLRNARLAAGILTALVGPFPTFAATAPTGRNFRVNVTIGLSERDPDVAADGAGNWIVVWRTSSNDTIAGRRFTSAGVPLGDEFTVTSLSSSRPALAVGPAGSFLVVWSNGSDVFARLLDAGATPQGGDFRVNTFTTSTQAYPDVAAGGDGSFVVTWQSGNSQDGDGEGVFAQRYDATGVPLGGEFQVNSHTTNRQRYASVTADAAGDFVVVWQSQYQDGDRAGGFGQRYDSAGVPQGGEFLVNTTTAGAQSLPKVGGGPAGDFIVAWNHGNTSLGGDLSIRARRFDAAGAPLGADFEVAGPAGDLVPILPRVGMDASGGILIAWARRRETGGAPLGIHAQRYESDGSAQGGELTVNTNLLLSRDTPAVAGATAGSFLLAWRDAIGPDVIAQRFSGSCGDGSVDAGETCDDGNDADGDGCAANCTLEECFACAGAPSSCTAITACAADGCCAPGCSAANDPDCPVLVSGALLSLRQDGGQGKRRLLYKSRDAQIDTTAGSGIDPVADGALLHVYNPSLGTAACFDLTTAGTALWEARGTPGAPIFTYHDRDGENGPCSTARLKDGTLLRVKCLSSLYAGLDYDLSTSPQGAVTVRFASGTTDYCAVFGGTVVWDLPLERFTTRKASPPGSCPVPPLPCPFRIDAP